MKKEALLLIDIQDLYFMPGPMRLHRPHQAANKAAALLEQFRREGKTVIHVKHRFQLFPDFQKLVKPAERCWKRFVSCRKLALIIWYNYQKILLYFAVNSYIIKLT